MMQRRWLMIAVVSVIVVVGLYAAGSFFIEQSVVEYYSRGWESASTSDAKRRDVFVTAPVVTPTAVAVSHSVEVRVTDAWVERPTHVVYRWHLLRHSVVDSGYRLVVHLTKGPIAGQPATVRNRECFAPVDFYLDYELAVSGGDFSTDTLKVASRAPFPDTVHLRVKPYDPAPRLRDQMTTPPPCQ